MKKLVFALSLVLWSLAACGRKNQEIVFDTSDPNALLPNVKWCVITEPYVPFYENTSWNSPTKGHCRKGDIFQIHGKHITEKEVWYKLEGGWVNESAIFICANKYMARTKASEL